MRRVPALDGLRGVAILMVLVGHGIEGPLAAMGRVGVALFFVLSGYLITGLLLAERERRGRIGLGGFYRRRARRLLPALLVMVAVVGSLTVSFGTPARAVAAQVLPVLGFAANWFPNHTGYMDPFNPMWSLGVEEQFYLAWPLLLGALAGRAMGRWWVGLGIAASLSSAFWLWGTGETWRTSGTDAVAFALLAGCLLAMRPVALPPRWAGPGVVALVGLGCTSPIWGRVSQLVAPMFAAAVAVMLLAACQGSFLERGWLRWFGDHSYSLYLWHVPAQFVFLSAGVPWRTADVVGCVLAVPVAVASRRWVELPFLSHPEPADAGTGQGRRALGQEPSQSGARNTLRSCAGAESYQASPSGDQ